MRPWESCQDLLDLFGVADCVGSRRFIALCEVGAVMRRAALPYSLGDLERLYMHDTRLSPLLWWSPIKRAVAPLLAAGGETLRALGVPVSGEPATAHQLAAAVAAALADGAGEQGGDFADHIAQRLEAICDHKI